MEAVADLADRFSFGELRVSHEQNLVLADVRQSELEQLCGSSSRRCIWPPPTSAR
jgi:sulfite reductase beta subunit-like hemoprotein